MNDTVKEYSENIIFLIIGCLIYTLGISLFITPAHLYSGGIMGVSQIIRTLLLESGITFNFEISGIINFILNIPLMIIAYRSISKRFFYFTALSIAVQTLFFILIPIMSNPILEDRLASCLVGGFIAGFGIGLILRSRGSGGGIDILGILFTNKFSNFSVGKLSLIVNTCLYILCAFIFSVETAIYSMIFLVVSTFTIDRVHYQNINMTAMIFTRHYKDVVHVITEDLHRGVTYWEGAGGYTDEETYVVMTAISKYEIPLLKHKVKDIDEHAFIIFSEGLSLSGNFKKRL